MTFNFDRKELNKRIESAVKRIYTGPGVYGHMDSFKMDFYDDDDDFYGTMVVSYGRSDNNREDLNFENTVRIYVGPKDLVNYDFFEGMVYMAIDMKE